MERADYLDQIVLFAGDGDFRSLIEALQGRGVRVTVVSTIESRPPMVADELRRQAEVFIDLMELKPKIIREERSQAPRVIRIRLWIALRTAIGDTRPEDHARRNAHQG
jgi:uncharacterized LabA/DUF88 family protein